MSKPMAPLSPKTVVALALRERSRMSRISAIWRTQGPPSVQARPSMRSKTPAFLRLSSASHYNKALAFASISIGT